MPRNSLSENTPHMASLFDFGQTEMKSLFGGSNEGEYKMIQPTFKPLSDCLAGDLVVFRVGPKRKSYHVHKALLRDRANVVLSQLECQSQASQDNEIHVPESHGSAMDLFLKWLYEAKLDGPNGRDDLSRYLTLLVLSKRFQIEYLHNLTMDLVRTYLVTSVGSVEADNVAYVYNNLPDSGLPQMMTEIAAKQHLNSPFLSGLGPGFEDLLKQGGQFAAEMSKCLLRRSDLLSSDIALKGKIRKNCEYHLHKTTPICKVSKHSTIFPTYDAFKMAPEKLGTPTSNIQPATGTPALQKPAFVDLTYEKHTVEDAPEDEMNNGRKGF